MTMNSDRPSNPGISHILHVRMLKETIKYQEARIAILEQENKALLEGLSIAGWWCSHRLPSGELCNIFNGEEHSKRAHCRYCGTEKKVHEYHSNKLDKAEP